jgi:hypothetical protein
MPRASKRVAHRRQEGLARDQRLGQRGQLDAEFVGLLQQDAQEGGCAHIAVGLQVGHCRHLLLGLADAGRKHRAAQRLRAGFEDPGARRHVIGEAVVHQVAGAKARGKQRPRRAPVIRAAPFRFVDGARRRKHTPEPAPLRSGQAAEGSLLLLQLDQVALAHHRQGRQRGSRGDRRGIKILQRLTKVGGIGLGMRDLLRQPCRQRRLSFVGGAGFEDVKIIGHGMLRIEWARRRA